MEKIVKLIKTPTLEINKIYSSKPYSDLVCLNNHFECGYLLCGEACLLFEESKTLFLKNGDFFQIEPNTKHTVRLISETAIWLTFHFFNIE